MKNMPTVMRIARVIRRSAEQQEPYHKSLDGWCVVTSNILFAELCRRGIRSRLTWNGGHCFLTYGRYLIDITATQFDSKLPKVVKLLRHSYYANTSWWQEDESVGTMKNCLLDQDWATSAGIFEKQWQKQIRAHLKTLK